MEPRDLSTHTPYQAGRGIEEVARDLGRAPGEFTKLSSNENPLGPSPDAIRAIREHAPDASVYPKASHADLTNALADRWDVATDQVWLGNGGDGVLDYLGRAFLNPSDSVLVPSPGFVYYGMSARFNHATVDEYPLEKAHDFAITPGVVLEAYRDHRIVYVTTPNNPTGGWMKLDAIRGIAEQTSDHTLVVVDEAYAEFSDQPSAVELLPARDDIAVLRTFSKAYGLAGCRIGYALVPAAWADAYARVNTPFAVGELSCRAGLAALGDDGHLQRTVDLAQWSRDYMQRNLEARVWESAANFVLAEVGDAASVTNRLQERGVIVRDCTTFGLPECVRISCGTRDQTRQVVDALNDTLA